MVSKVGPHNKYNLTSLMNKVKDKLVVEEIPTREVLPFEFFSDIFRNFYNVHIRLLSLCCLFLFFFPSISFLYVINFCKKINGYYKQKYEVEVMAPLQTYDSPEP